MILTSIAWADEPVATNTEAAAEEEKGPESTEALAKAAQNPVANLISIPFQNNFNFGVGPDRVTQYVMNFQPVIPITLNDDWNLITRWITPVINQPSVAPGQASGFGIGDINPSLFLSPANSGKLIWGIGPTVTLPTATEPILGGGKWDAGPTVVALTILGPWVYGVLVNNQWSFAGWGNNNFNGMVLQEFVNYNLDKGWYLTSSPVNTANWEANGRNMWTVPIGGGVGRLFRLGKLPINAQLAAYCNVHTPVNGPDWQLRFQVQILLPKSILEGKK